MIRMAYNKNWVYSIEAIAAYTTVGGKLSPRKAGDNMNFSFVKTAALRQQVNT